VSAAAAGIHPVNIPSPADISHANHVHTILMYLKSKFGDVKLGERSKDKTQYFLLPSGKAIPVSEVTINPQGLVIHQTRLQQQQQYHPQNDHHNGTITSISPQSIQSHQSQQSHSQNTQMFDT